MKFEVYYGIESTGWRSARLLAQPGMGRRPCTGGRALAGALHGVELGPQPDLGLAQAAAHSADRSSLPSALLVYAPLSAVSSCAPMKRFELEIEGVRLPVFESGEGEPLLLLHGYPQDHRCWLPVVPRLAKKRRVIALDWFGWGESEQSLTMIPRYADEIRRVGAVLDALGLADADLFGHDYGGLLAMGFAAASPDRVRRLALINTRAHRRPAFAWYLLFTLISLGGRVPVLRALLATLPLHWAHMLALRRYVANGSFSTAELDDYLRSLRAARGRRWLIHFYRHFRAEAHPELGEAADRMIRPVALIWGDRDSMFPVATGEDLARRIKGSRLTRIAGGDHYIMEERPAEVAAALEELLDTPYPPAWK